MYSNLRFNRRNLLRPSGTLLHLFVSGSLLLSSAVASGAEIDLGTLDGTNGVVFYGPTAGDSCGYFLSGAGDINRDGFCDLLLGNVWGDGPSNGRVDAGESFLVKGRGTGFPASMELTGMGSSNGFVIYGPTANDLSGVCVAPAGDVNQDGFGDFMIGARQADGALDGSYNSGEAYLVFGKGASFGTSLDMRSPGSNAIIYTGGNPMDYAGSGTSTADVNGDGYWDVLLGAFGADGPSETRSGSGEGYVVYGKPVPDSMNLSTLAAPTGVTLYGGNIDDGLGRSASGIGDVNGDGYDDVLLGARYSDGPANSRPFAGDSYVIFGTVSGLGTSIELENLDGKNGFIIHGAEQDDRTSFSVSGIGDFNGDGLDDFAIGGRFSDGPGNARPDAGETYLIYGKSTGFAAEIDLASLAPTDGSTIYAAETGDRAISASGAGDVNGDGFFDLFVGVHHADGPSNLRNDAGEAFVIYGRSAGLGAGLDLLSFNDTDGIRFLGKDAGDNAGVCVASAGDANGDGFADMLIGARYGDGPTGTRTDAGECYLVFGSANGAPPDAVYHTRVAAGNSPRQAIGTIGNGADEFSPASRCWIDFNGGDNGSGGASHQTVTLSRSNATISNLENPANALWEIDSDRVGWTNAVVTFRYTDAEISQLHEPSIGLHRADSPSGPWTLLPTNLDTATNTATASVSTFSYFALAGDRIPSIPLGIELLDPVSSSLDGVRFGVEFNEAVSPTFTADDLTLTGTLAANASVGLTGSGGDPFYQILVIMDDPDQSGTIGVRIDGSVTDQSLPPNVLEVPVDSSLYTITNFPDGDLNQDGTFDVADVAFLADALLGLVALP